jgi:hypothetical protein
MLKAGVTTRTNWASSAARTNWPFALRNRKPPHEKQRLFKERRGYIGADNKLLSALHRSGSEQG